MNPQLSDSPEELAAELELIEAELERRSFVRDPVRWVEVKLCEQLWSVQKKILQALVRHRKVAVASCHEIGKSFIAGRAVGWWVDSHPPNEAFVVTSAPSAPQVRTILWKEIGRVHAKGKLTGRVNQTEWIVPGQNGGKEEQAAIGRKPNDYDPTSFQGIHAPFVLYVFDEACGMPGELWEAADSLIANNNGRALAIGNPDDPTTEFAQICKPGSGWHVIHVSAFDTPNFTGEPMATDVLDQLIGHLYVEEKRRKWARQWIWNKDKTAVICPPGVRREDAGPVWFSKVLGEFPLQSQDQGLIPVTWIRAAQERNLEPIGSNRLGVDVGAGGDSSTCCQAKGPVVRILWENRNPDTMQTTGLVISTLRETNAEVANVDTIGIGKGVVDRGKELGKNVVGINVGEGADSDEDFANLRAELWWHVRTLFETGQIDIDTHDDELADELQSLRYKRTSSGRIQIESKDEAKKRGVASPNRADAVMLALAKGRKKKLIATWGR